MKSFYYLTWLAACALILTPVASRGSEAQQREAASAETSSANSEHKSSVESAANVDSPREPDKGAPDGSWEEGRILSKRQSRSHSSLLKPHPAKPLFLLKAAPKHPTSVSSAGSRQGKMVTPSLTQNGKPDNSSRVRNPVPAQSVSASAARIRQRSPYAAMVGGQSTVARNTGIINGTRMSHKP